MTEIKIQRKKRPIWPWIVALLVVALVIWLLSEFGAGERDIDVIENDTLEINMAPVQDHITFMQQTYPDNFYSINT